MLGKSIGVLGISTIWLENLLEYRRDPEDCQRNALEYQENLVASTEIYWNDTKIYLNPKEIH